MSQHPTKPPVVEPPTLELARVSSRQDAGEPAEEMRARAKPNSLSALPDNSGKDESGTHQPGVYTNDHGPTAGPAVSPSGPACERQAAASDEVQEATDPEAATYGTDLDETVLSDSLSAPQAQFQAGQRSLLKLWQWPFWLLGRTWDLLSLMVLLAVVAAIPIVQLASLGYLLRAAGNLAKGCSWSSALPGLRLAGKLGTFILLATLGWLPVWFVTDLAYSAQLLQPDSGTALLWRIAAFLTTVAWVTVVIWTALRGGRWWHFLWPAPLRFVKEIWRPSLWSRANRDLYDFVVRLHFPQLWWLGLRAGVGALLWIALPVSMMIIGQRAEEFSAAGLVGFLGALAMTLVMLYLPFLQIQFATENRFTEFFRISDVRKRFKFAPWATALSLVTLCLLSIPLYLLRIEATPQELVWAPALVFVVFMLPAKLMLGASIGYANRRTHLRQRHWSLRWSARLVALVGVLVYVGALYVAQLVAGQGAFVMYFQHAFLVPAPLV